MNCFIHSDSQAVGACKSCGKAVCHECALDLGFAVCCSPSCETDAREIYEMNQKAKRMYGIGTTTNKASSQAVGYLAMGVFFIVVGLLFFPKIPAVTYFAGSMGILMLGMAAFVHRRMKSFGIQI